MFIEDDERGAFDIEASFDSLVDEVVDSPRLDASESFNLLVIELSNQLESKHLSARSNIVVNHDG